MKPKSKPKRFVRTKGQRSVLRRQTLKETDFKMKRFRAGTSVHEKTKEILNELKNGTIVRVELFDGRRSPNPVERIFGHTYSKKKDWRHLNLSHSPDRRINYIGNIVDGKIKATHQLKKNPKRKRYVKEKKSWVLDPVKNPYVRLDLIEEIRIRARQKTGEKYTKKERRTKKK